MFVRAMRRACCCRVGAVQPHQHAVVRSLSTKPGASADARIDKAFGESGGVPVPIYIEISHLHRTATFIARGSISPDELRTAAEQLLDAGVPHYAKLIDVSGAVIDAGLAEGIAALMRARHADKRGPMALLIDPGHDQFARAFAATQSSHRPVSLFTSLRQARDWLAQPHDTPVATPVAPPAAPGQPASKPWSDPQRQAVLIRGTRRRDLAVGRPNRSVN
jgi:hypothetical protein